MVTMRISSLFLLLLQALRWFAYLKSLLMLAIDLGVECNIGRSVTKILGLIQGLSCLLFLRYIPPSEPLLNRSCVNSFKITFC